MNDCLGFKIWDLSLEYRPEPKSETYTPCLICTHLLREMNEVSDHEGLGSVRGIFIEAVVVMFLLISVSFLALFLLPLRFSCGSMSSSLNIAIRASSSLARTAISNG
jgi:hypothetical protein